jgi:phosphoglycolate phosphatase
MRKGISELKSAKKHWFFDLDGTLACTGEDIRLAWRGALGALGRDLSRFDEVFRIGPTLEKLTYELYPDATPELVSELLGKFKPLYDESGFPNTEPYPGVERLLESLKAAGAKIYIVTNKRHAPTVRMAAKFGWDRVFDGIWSYDTLGVKYTKSELLARIVSELGIDAGDAAMVGDTKVDVDAGKANSMTSVGVAYGYGTAQELSGADFVFDSADALRRFALPD